MEADLQLIKFDCQHNRSHGNFVICPSRIFLITFFIFISFPSVNFFSILRTLTQPNAIS